MATTAATAVLDVRLFGGFAVAVAGNPVPAAAWRRKRVASLVKVLALEPTHRMHREQVLEALWPDADPTAADNNLRFTLHEARKRLGEAGANRNAFLTREGEVLVLGPTGSVAVDIDAFERAAAAAWRSDDLALAERALDLYVGDLLPDDPYEEWTESRRGALRATYITLLARTAQLNEQRGELGKAIGAIERLLATEPLAEERHTELIRLLAVTGQRRRAMEQVVRLVRILKRELGAEPQPATRELALAIRDGHFPEHVLPLQPPRAPSAPLTDVRSGTVTVLLALLVGDADTKKLAELQRIAEAVVVRHGGRSSAADGGVIQAVFPLAAGALEAALGVRAQVAATLGVAPDQVPLRAALHSGDALAGADVSAHIAVAAELAAAARPGQVLISRATKELVGDAPAAGLGMQVLGDHVPKRGTAPIRVYGVVGPGLPALELWPLPTAGLPRTIPAPVEMIVGREREVAELRHLLGGKRLVTLTGPGGVGKTRLAIAVAEAATEAFPDGEVLAELASVGAPELVVPVIARALGVLESDDTPLFDAVADEIGEHRLLLVLDNCEHLTGVADVLSHLLARCPRLAVLATSRSRLRLKGEQEYVVSPLAVPEAENGIEPALTTEAGQYPAVTLFVERAREARPDFHLGQETVGTIGEIVRRLDGLPLAIELAAARVRLFSPGELLVRLARPLDLLTGGPHDAPARQQTLRATIAWSFDLLEAQDQILFRQLAVFAGGFPIEALEAVSARLDGGLDVLEGLATLVDQSLVRERRQPDGQTRFAMLETIREFAREKLSESGEEDSVRDTHAMYYLDFAERARAGFAGEEQASWLDWVDSEHDNLRVALGWLLRSGTAAQALRLTAALWWFWWVRGHLSEGRAWLAHALSLGGDVPPELRARALYGSGSLAEAQNDYGEAVRLHEDALALFRTEEDAKGLADALTSLGQIAQSQADYDHAEALIGEALAVSRSAGDEQGVAYALVELGTVAAYRGAGSLALDRYVGALETLRALGDQRGSAVVLMNVASLVFLEGDPDRALPLYEEALALWTELGDSQERAMVLNNLGEVMQHRGDLDAASAFYDEALPVYQELGDRRNAARVLANLGLVARDRGDLAGAADLIIGSLNLSATAGDDEALARGLESLGGIAVAMGEPVRGVRWLGRAESLREEIGAPLPPIAVERHERGVAVARKALDAGDFAAAWAAGRELPIGDVPAEVAALTPGSITQLAAFVDEVRASGHRPRDLSS